MKFAALLDGQKRDRYVSLAWKGVLDAVRPPQETRPIFLFGKQRSGTSMLMSAFHRHPQLMVYDEHRNSRAFYEYRIRSFETINKIIRQSSFPVVCFKPICDSHRVSDFAKSFIRAHFIWIYRDYRDVANSSLRKFSQATRAIRLVCEGKQGGGWLQEGITPEMQCVLSDIYRENLSDFDLGCLVWWARNKIIVNSAALTASNVTVLKYEALVTNPESMLRWLFDRMEIPFHSRVGARLTARSIGRHAVPDMNERVRGLCDNALEGLDNAFGQICPGNVRTQIA